MTAATGVHCAITRRVRAGKEAEFEDALKSFLARSMDHYGTTGAHLLRPASNSQSREYGILRSFNNEQHMQEFYDSKLFVDWQNEVEDLVEGNPVHRQLHGLEAFFYDEKADQPPRWKMAIITWLGVFPAVLLSSRFLSPVLMFLPPILSTAIVNLCVVVALAWGVMPMLTKLFAPWLTGDRNDD